MIPITLSEKFWIKTIMNWKNHLSFFYQILLSYKITFVNEQL